MNADGWKDIAMVVLSVCGVLVTGVTGIVWAKITKLEDTTDTRFEKAADTYARKDDTDKLEARIMDALVEIKSMVHTLMQKVH